MDLQRKKMKIKDYFKDYEWKGVGLLDYIYTLASVYYTCNIVCVVHYKYKPYANPIGCWAFPNSVLQGTLLGSINGPWMFPC
jgi:hypothetical protein